MAKAKDEITISKIIDIEKTARYYLLQSSTASVPSKPTTNPPGGSWSTTEPSYTSGSTSTLYFVDLTVMSDDSFSYSAVSKSSSYEAAKAAYNKASNVEKTVTDFKQTSEGWQMNWDKILNGKDANTSKHTDYITFKDGNIKLGDSISTKTLEVSNESVEISYGNTVIAKFGEETRIGDPNARNVVINDGGFKVMNADVTLAHLGYGSTTNDKAPYYTFGTRVIDYEDANRKISSPGALSVVEGDNNLAGHIATHAEGTETKALHIAAHSEGQKTIAAGIASHAEGEATAAYGYASHAEGSESSATGTASHVEGTGTFASGAQSHASGLHTHAYGTAQTVIGKWNNQYGYDSNLLPSQSDNDAYDFNKYLFIIGNGTDESHRSECHAVDVDGNAYYAGNVSALSFNGHTIESNIPTDAKFTDTNTWRPVVDNLTSDDTDKSLSAKQGKTLKNAIDTIASSKQIGTVTCTAKANTPTATHVNFPKAFASAPIVLLNPLTAVPGTVFKGCSATNITTTGFDLYVTRTDNGNTSVKWIAII